MSAEQKAPLSNRQHRELRRKIAAEKAEQAKQRLEQGYVDPPKPREEYVAPVVKHADDVVIPGLSGRGTVLRTDTLWKLYNTGKINAVQYSAGVDYLRIVENYFASASGLAKLSDEAGQVGGTRDPINRYLKARPMRLGYVPTQRPRKPASSRSHGDGWTAAKLAALGQFGKVSAMVQRLPVEQRRALCLIVIDPSAPDRPPIPITRVVELIYGSKGSRGFQRVVGWLARALDEMDQGLVEELRAA